MKIVYFVDLLPYKTNPLLDPIVKTLGSSYKFKYINNTSMISIRYLTFILIRLKIFFSLMMIKNSTIHSFEIETTFLALILNRFRKNKIIFSYLEIWSDTLPDSSVRLKIMASYYRKIEKYTLMNSNIVIFPTQLRKEYIKNKYVSMAESKLHVIENMSVYGKDVFKNKEILASLKHKHIVYMGTFNESRRLDLLMSISEELRNNGIRIYLFGDQNDSLKNLLNFKNVYYLGKVEHDEMIDMLKKCHIGIAIYGDHNANNYLCAPTKIFDYINAEIPFVAVNFPYINEIKNRVNVEILKTFELNKKDLLSAILELDRDYDRYKSNIENIDKSPYRFESQKSKIINIYTKA